jgi:hypothetical protein
MANLLFTNVKAAQSWAKGRAIESSKSKEIPKVMRDG